MKIPDVAHLTTSLLSLKIVFGCNDALPYFQRCLKPICLHLINNVCLLLMKHFCILLCVHHNLHCSFVYLFPDYLKGVDKRVVVFLYFCGIIKMPVLTVAKLCDFLSFLLLTFQTLSPLLIWSFVCAFFSMRFYICPGLFY